MKAHNNGMQRTALHAAADAERCRGRFAPATTGRRIDIRRLLGASRRTTSG